MNSGCDVLVWYGGEVETVPLGRRMGLRWIVKGVERVSVMRRVEDGEMSMPFESEAGEGVDVW